MSVFTAVSLKQQDGMADSKLLSPRPGTSSPPPNCAICLGTCSNKCYSDSCMHEFCFKCLLEWSKIKAECPLCKQTFKSIIHNIKSIDEYDEHVVENITVDDNRYLENGSASLIYLPQGTPPGLHQYHFRTTFTVDTHGEHAIQQMLLTHPLLTIGTFTPERYNHRRRRGDTSATTFRRSIYSQNLWVYAPPDITGRFRDVSPSYFRNNPAARTRLAPWLNRELNALLYENTQLVMRLVDIIMDHLLRHHICSYSFRFLLSEYLGNKTDQFIHEFYNFMRSPYDMIGYDRHVIYTERRPSPIPFIDVSDYDSDVILVSASSNTPRENQSNEPVVINLIDTDSDEPILVSEERNETSFRLSDDDEPDREPILPLKLRIKNKHRTWVKKRSRGKKRQYYEIASKRSTSSSSTSTSSRRSSSSDSDTEYRRYKQKMAKKYIKEKNKKRKEGHSKKLKVRSSDNSDLEDDLPLSSFTNRKHSKSKHKSHGLSNCAKDANNKKLRTFVDKLKSERNETFVKSENSNEKLEIKKDPSENSNQDDVTSQVITKDEPSDHTCESNESDNGFYSDYRPTVKSKIKDLRTEDKQNAGPSSGRLRNILRKEVSSNLWYSRPCAYDSEDSSGN